MRYINLRFTLLLLYFTTGSSASSADTPAVCGKLARRLIVIVTAVGTRL